MVSKISPLGFESLGHQPIFGPISVPISEIFQQIFGPSSDHTLSSSIIVGCRISLNLVLPYISAAEWINGFLLHIKTSFAGRVAVEYIDSDPEIQKKKYAFKCHRIKEGPGGSELIYPVNSLVVHPVYGTMASGGSDGLVNIWDISNKKRMSQFKRQPTTISSLDFSKDGKALAIAVSYLFEREDQPSKPCQDHVVIRTVAEHEVKPK